jgi:hypothetical protein
MIFADLIHNQSLGIKTPTLVTILLIIVLAVIFLIKTIKKVNSNESSIVLHTEGLALLMMGICFLREMNDCLVNLAT